jgi:UDP-N-acetylglucosamine--N-acetylmuramyl-(pentapeptide) pyrophosphoryl-undecaprenol N-acetylglucosamine transferase
MKTPSNARTIVLAAGGTGGHIFPAEALAEEMLLRGFEPHLVTDHRFHQYNKNSTHGVLGRIPIHTITAGSLGGKFTTRVKNALGMVRGTAQAAQHLRALQPAAVGGIGGYPSFPTMFAAVLMGRVSVIHEQNSVLGRVNKLLARKVKLLATSYRDMRGLPPKLAQVQFTGNPVRAALRALAQVEYPALQSDGILRVLVVGGSQGASVFSRVVPEAMTLLPPQVRARIRLDQQCRAGEIDTVRAAYDALGMQVDLAPFFVDMAARLAAAHLVICRAGASTVAELMSAGRPALLVPLPQATDNHQYYNAQAIEDVGAGWVVTQDAFTPQALASKLETMLLAPQRLSECAAAMRSLGQPNAASALADAVLQAAGLATPSAPPMEHAA